MEEEERLILEANKEGTPFIKKCCLKHMFSMKIWFEKCANDKNMVEKISYDAKYEMFCFLKRYQDLNIH